MAFLYDARRATPSGLACELVVPFQEDKHGKADDVLKEQFAKTPYAVAFRSRDTTFILVTLHIKFGQPAERLPELQEIALWMREWATETADDLNQNLMALGDFNIDRAGDANFQAFVSAGLHVPDELMGLPRTLPATSETDKFYDQIAWFDEGGREKLTLEYTNNAGNFRWDRFLFTDMERTPKSFRISDHFPLWCEFGLPRP
jgi:endonuclease/exonuclease/phosphatase family metal-dependent hydrolase